MLTNSVDKVYILASTVKKEAAKADCAMNGAIGPAFFWRAFGNRTGSELISLQSREYTQPSCRDPCCRYGWLQPSSGGILQ